MYLNYREMFISDCMVAFAQRRVKPVRGEVERLVAIMLKESGRAPNPAVVRDLAQVVLGRVL